MQIDIDENRYDVDIMVGDSPYDIVIKLKRKETNKIEKRTGVTVKKPQPYDIWHTEVWI